MQQIFDMLAKGNYHGLTLLMIVVVSGVAGDMRVAREDTLKHMGPDSSTAEFIVGAVAITMNFMIMITLAVTIILLILRDAGLISLGKK